MIKLLKAFNRTMNNSADSVWVGLGKVFLVLIFFFVLPVAILTFAITHFPITTVTVALLFLSGFVLFSIFSFLGEVYVEYTKNG